MKRKIVSYVLVLCMVIALFPAIAQADSAQASQADVLVAHARTHIGDEYNNFYDSAPFKNKYAWCAAFVQHCSAKAGLADIIPTSGCELASKMTTNIVNSKNGKITFVNKSSYNSKKGSYNKKRVSYNGSYKPKKGDIIVFQGSSGRISHVGIVSENSPHPTKNVRTIEGNVSGKSKSHRIVKEYAKRKGYSGETIIAYVTPDYEALNGTRYAGSDRYSTSVSIAEAVKSEMGVSEFDNIVVAYGKNYPDALAGGYLAKVKNAPILLVDKKVESTVSKYISENLKSGGTVYLLGGTGAVSADFENRVKGIAEANVVRLGGTDRYDTNLKILAEAGVVPADPAAEAAGSSVDLLICTGKGYADSLSASATGRPILLVGSALTEEQAAYIESLGDIDMYVIGGTGAVSQQLYDELAVFGTDLERIAGTDRYNTSRLIAEKFCSAGSGKAVLASGGNFPDGLSGGPLAMAMDAPLLLAKTYDASQAGAVTAKLGAKNIYVLGGHSLISNGAVNRIVK